MAVYRVELSRSAEKALFKLPKTALQKIVAALKGLEASPYPPGCRKLSGETAVYRIRIQVYRIVYEVYDELVLVKVLKIGHRKDVYR